MNNSENFKPYSEEEAWNEAKRLEEEITSGRAEDYSQAEKNVEEDYSRIKEELITKLKNEHNSNARRMIRTITSSLPERILQSEEVRQAAKEGFIDRLSNGHLDNIFFNPIETIRLKEKKLAAGEEFMDHAPDAYIDEALEIIKVFSLPKEIIQSEEAQQAAKEEFIRRLEYGDTHNALKIKKVFSLPEEMVQQAAKKWFLSHLTNGHINTALEIKEAFSLPEKILQSAEVKQAVKEGFIYRISYGDINIALEIKETFSLPEEIMQSEEVRQAAEEGLIWCLSKGHTNDALKIIEAFPLPEEMVQQAVKEGFIRCLSEEKIDTALKIKEAFLLPEEMVQQAAKEELIRCLTHRYINTALKIIEAFPLPKEIMQSEEVRQAAEEGLISCLSEWEIDNALKIKEAFLLPEEMVQQAAKEELINHLSEGKIDTALKIKETFLLPEEMVQQAAKEVLIRFLSSGDIDTALEIKKVFSLRLDKNDKEAIKPILIFSTYPGSFPDLDIDLADYSEDELKAMWQKVKELPMWQDEQTIAGPFQDGVKIFGYRPMLEYIKRDNLSLHDAVHAFRDILKLFKISGLSESKFYGQILQQVKMDNGEYPEGTAHHHLNAIASTVNTNINEVIAEARKYMDIKRLQEMVETFSDPSRIFASWKSLKKYSELEQLLGRTEILNELKKLREAGGSEKLYDYIETLAFHPDSKISIKAVMQFWRDPKSFLAAEDSSAIHDTLKPSNYLDMPNLDLTAPELRDALVEGKMDGLSAFAPLEIRYTITLEDTKPEPLPDLIRKALGSRKKGIKGAAKNPPKLFNELQKLLEKYGTNVVEYIQNRSFPEGVNTQQAEQEIKDLLYNEDFGLERPKNTREFVARISPKSDPEAAIAGDDTATCMPFGSGKNTVYTFNPNTAQFVIRVVKSDGRERTIAQSVLTQDRDVGTPVSEIIPKLKQEVNLEDILPADILDHASAYVACDNVEVAPNYGSELYQRIIEVIYRDFFREYMRRYSEAEGLNPEKVPVGRGHSDALTHLPTERNTFIPQAPISYSDKIGADVYILDLKSDKGLDLILQRKVREIEVQKQQNPPLPKIKGLDYLTFRDTLRVAYIEGKAYSDNPIFIQSMFIMENELIAKDINNAAKGRPNMSLKYTDDEGRMRGYILAWEGRLTDESVKYEVGEFFDQPCIYIADLATDRKSRMAGGRLIQGFVELYKQNYLDRGNLIPIFAIARENTSYRIIKRHLDRISEKTGVSFESIELPTYKVGEDTMHPIIIRPVLRQP